MSRDELIAYLVAVSNDLEGAAERVMPGLLQTEAVLRACNGCLHARMSGAGPTWYGVFENQAQAQAAARKITAAHPTWRVKPTVLG